LVYGNLVTELPLLVARFSVAPNELLEVQVRGTTSRHF
jgi:hypothetical protein